MIELFIIKVQNRERLLEIEALTMSSKMLDSRSERFRMFLSEKPITFALTVFVKQPVAEIVKFLHLCIHFLFIGHPIKKNARKISG